MLVFLDEIWLNLRFADVADILVVSILLYFGLQWLRKRAARAAAAALCMLALAYVGARLFNMYLTLMVFQTGLTLVVVSLVVIFQQDIRRTFEQLSSWRGFHHSKSTEDWAIHIDTLIETSATLANQKIGALMVLEGRQPLDPYIEGGVAIKGRISTELLISIFHPATPGHDGAVVLHRDRIEMLGAYLPLSRNLDQIGKGGTRHAAALGLAEACDALVIVVSEERGTISLAEEGRLAVQDSIAALKNRLEAFYLDKFAATQENGLARSWRRNWALKTLSVGLASLIFFLVAFRPETKQLRQDVRIVLGKPKHLKIDGPYPAETGVFLIGSERDFNTVNLNKLTISIDLEGFPEGEKEITLEKKYLNLPSGLSVGKFETPTVKFRLYSEP